MKEGLKQAGVVLLSIAIFVGLFIFVGSEIPRLYYNNVNVDRFLNVERMYAPDIQSDQDIHRVVLERDSDYEGAAIAVTDLVLMTDSGDTIKQLEHFQSREYFETNVEKVVIEFDMPDGLEPGTYRYYVNLTLNLPYGVKRYVNWRSNRFKVRSA